MKKICVMLGLLMILFGMMSTFSYGADQSIEIYVDNQKLVLDVQPINVNGRVLVPLKVILESFGLETKWDAQSESVIAKSNQIEMILPISSKVAFVNGKAVTLEVSAILFNNRTFVPIKFISESLGATVYWNSTTTSVHVSRPSSQANFTLPPATPEPAPVTPAPATPEPAPAPVTPAPVTPTPVTPAPVTPAPIPVTPAPIPVTPAPVTPTPAPNAELSTGIYSIKQASTNSSLDVANYGTANGTNLQLANYVGNSAQLFKIEKIENAYRIWSVCSPNLVVDIGGNDYSTRKNGTNIDLWKLNVDYSKSYWKDQEWKLVKLSDGYYSIQPVHYSDLALGINGSNIELKTLDTSDVNQRWTIESSAWTPRTVAPSTSDKNYYSKSNIFYPNFSPGAFDTEYQKVIQGNCTWYVCGRILELYGISGVGSRFGDASQWWNANKNYYGTNNPKYKYGNTPKLGAIAVFSYGHVAIVEGIGNNTITISESLFRGKNPDVLFQYRTLSTTEYGKIVGYIYPNE